MLNRLLIIVLLVAATVVYSLYKKSVLDQQLSIQGKEAAVLGKLPAASFRTLNGENVDLHQMYKDGPVNLLVVHFWGTWCAPCEAELPDLLGIAKRFEGRVGIKFLLVAVNDEIGKVKKHIRSLPKSGAHWLIDNDNVYRDLFGTTRVPETFVFSSDMTTLRKYVGPQEWNKGLFFQSFDEFLQISTRKL